MSLTNQINVQVTVEIVVARGQTLTLPPGRVWPRKTIEIAALFNMEALPPGLRVVAAH